MHLAKTKNGLLLLTKIDTSGIFFLSLTRDLTLSCDNFPSTPTGQDIITGVDLDLSIIVKRLETTHESNVITILSQLSRLRMKGAQYVKNIVS